jgi:hypothetical protein
MNTKLKNFQQLGKNLNFTKSLFYRFVLRTKIKRLDQPGLTRYNWDDQAYNQMSYEVYLILIFK